MPCTLREAKAKVKQVEAKKQYPKMLGKAKKQNERTATAARKSLAKASPAVAKFKEEAARANAQALQARLGKVRTSDVDATAKVLRTLLANLREPL